MTTSTFNARAYFTGNVLGEFIGLHDSYSFAINNAKAVCRRKLATRDRYRARGTPHYTFEGACSNYIEVPNGRAIQYTRDNGEKYWEFTEYRWHPVGDYIRREHFCAPMRDFKYPVFWRIHMPKEVLKEACRENGIKRTHRLQRQYLYSCTSKASKLSTLR
jgi:hypothetical protein